MSVLPDAPTRIQTIGAKASVLAELRDAGFPVPDFETSPSDLLAARRRLGTPLAVRSCAAVEDGPTASFAGQFHTALNVGALDELEHAVATCRASCDSPTVREYCRRNRIDATSIRMDVIVQRMVAAELSGVAFSVDPVCGGDDVVIEACEGLGDRLLAGQRKPVADDHPLLARWRPAIEQLARDVQRHFGAPQDIEFAIDDQRLWLLQARPITRITFPPSIGAWTNADFRDGGVSASVCSPLMWSLYERVWSVALLGFLREIRLLARDDEFEAGRLFFGRPYWNLGAVKRCLSVLPGYVERRLDEDLSVAPVYEGDGVTTPVTLRAILRALPSAWALRRFFRRQELFDRAFLGGRFEAIAQRYEPLPPNPVDVLLRLVAEDFMLTECEYFRTIFAASLAKLDFKDAFPDADEAALVSGIGPLRHLAPLHHMRRMRRVAATGQRDVDDLLHRFRHHQPLGLDVIHPRWDEQRDYVERLLATTPPESHARCENDAARIRAQYLVHLPRRQRPAFNRKLDRLRAFLCLREEMRDCSSRIYYLIRRCALAIAQERGLGDDIFFMTVEEIAGDDRSNIPARRDVYERFRKFDAPNEIGGGHALMPLASNRQPGSTLRGLAAGRGCVRGTARIVRSVEEASHLQRGAILVCPFVDPGWTCVLDRAAAVVTETGGLLSHAAVICREFGLPAVLGVSGATQHIRNGSVIEVDGDCGAVRCIESQEE